MSLFSSQIKVIFIIALAFPHSETAFASSGNMCKMPYCNVYTDKLHFCTREMDPILQPMAKLTPINAFSAMKSQKIVENLKFHHYSSCWLCLSYIGIYGFYCNPILPWILQPIRVFSIRPLNSQMNRQSLVCHIRWNTE